MLLLNVKWTACVDLLYVKIQPNIIIRPRLLRNYLLFSHPLIFGLEYVILWKWIFWKKDNGYKRLLKGVLGNRHSLNVRKYWNITNPGEILWKYLMEYIFSEVAGPQKINSTKNTCQLVSLPIYITIGIFFFIFGCCRLYV